MTEYNLKLDIPKRLEIGLRDPNSAISQEMGQGIRKSLITFQGSIKKNIVPGWRIGHPRGYFTGRLNRSIVYRMESRLRGIVGTNVVYGPIQEFGGEIKPKTAKMLAWKDRRTGKWAVARRVFIKPKKFFERGIKTKVKAVYDIMTKTMGTIGKRWGFK